METIKEAKYSSKDKDVVGATAHVAGEAAGRRVEWDIEITEYVKNSRATWRSTGGNLTAIGLTTLTPTERGCKVTFMIDYDLPYSILGAVVDKLLVGREAEMEIQEGLEKLKTIVER